MILIVTNKNDPTTDRVVMELHRRSENFLRFNTEEFPMNVKCTINIDTSIFDTHIDLGHNRYISMNCIKSVYYRRPGVYEFGTTVLSDEAKNFAQNECNAAIHGLWMALPALWINHPYHIRAAEFKVLQLQVASELGLRIPRTLITNDPKTVRDFYNSCNGNMIAKVLRSGVVEYKDRISLIYTTRILDKHFDCLTSLKYSPCIFQEYVNKKMEIRATIVGNQVFAAEIHSQNSERTKDDWRRYDFANTLHLPHTMSSDVEQKCINLIHHLHLKFGAIDLILTPQGEYIFLEVNPNGQWGWIEELTHLPICNAIVDTLINSDE